MLIVDEDGEGVARGEIAQVLDRVGAVLVVGHPEQLAKSAPRRREPCMDHRAAVIAPVAAGVARHHVHGRRLARHGEREALARTGRGRRMRHPRQQAQHERAARERLAARCHVQLAVARRLGVERQTRERLGLDGPRDGVDARLARRGR